MSLTLIGSPIGNKEDITLRALKTLGEADIIIGEELKTLRRRLSNWNITFREKTLFTLNEHTNQQELEVLLDQCSENNVCLMSDCGTLSFFDPGYSLVDLCRKNKIPVYSLPGVSSLTALMPYLPIKTEHFEVLGFPPQKEDKRKLFFKDLKQKTHPLFIMDTPYRLQKTLREIADTAPNSSMVLGINLTCDNECVIQGTAKECLKQAKTFKKENFVLMLYPGGF